MLVNWSGKLGQIFGGRIFRIFLLFLCALGILVGIYKAKGDRLVKEKLLQNKPLKHSATNLFSSGTTARWVIVANPGNSGDQYVCSVGRVAKDAAWRTIIIGDKVDCCRMPDCYSIHQSQFLRMSYRTATTLKMLMDKQPANSTVYKEVVRNLAYIWVIHRGARHVFDAYLDEYISAKVPIPKFEEELSRQLHTLALDESLALVEDKGRPRGNNFRNPYGHFGRPDVKLVPGYVGTQDSIHHSPLPVINSTSGRPTEFPTFRICEVRPPSIEKFLEIDEGWWDLRAPALVLPGDTMPPLCTRNTMFSPDVFWALPILPDYASDEANTSEDSLRNETSRIPPWYIRGLWSQSLLGDLGGSIRLTLSRVPTLQLNQNYFTGGDYEHSSSSQNISFKPSTSKLLKRWHCKSRSTFRCLLLMSKELSKSVYFGKNDLALIESWIIDLKSIHYAEPPMLPRRRSHTNPCLGADGLHGVSFFPALEPNTDLDSEDKVAQRNETLRKLVSSAANPRSKRDAKQWEAVSLSSDLTPPEEKSTYFSTDWSAYVPQPTEPSIHSAEVDRGLTSHVGPTTYYSHFRDAFKELEDSPSEFVRTLVSHSKHKAALVEKRLLQARNPKQLAAPLSNIKITSPPEEQDEYPILKAMAETMCPGFGPLIPYNAKKTYDDVLLIVVFSNQHYDLIPTLEVLYRSVFPNILYCGHPHISVDLFLRKYQTSEQRSFSFLPTYTKASYECVLGAMEMNYEVKGYVVITDETLMKPWNIGDLNKSRIWVSSSSTQDSRHVPVTKSTWENLDARGQKLPRLLDGIINTWKLFSYILVGHDSWIMDPTNKGRIKRSTDEKAEVLEAQESSYVPNIDSYSALQNTKTSEYSNVRNQSDPTSTGNLAALEQKQSNALRSEQDGEQEKVLDSPISANETSVTEETEEDVEVGEEDDNEQNSSQGYENEEYEIVSEASSTASSTTENIPVINDELESVILAPPSSEIPGLENSTTGFSGDNENFNDTVDGLSTTATPNSSVGVPLYHVEHIEPPTPPTWHRPEDDVSSSEKPGNVTMAGESENGTKNNEDVETHKERISITESVAKSAEEIVGTSSSSSYPSSSGSSNDSPSNPSITVPPPALDPSSSIPDNKLKKEMEALLDNVQEVYLNMLHLVSEYKEMNESAKSHEFGVDGAEPRTLLEDTKSHRISPREFRHIRCTLNDDGHQSELCTSLRTFITTLGQNLGGELELDYDNIPMYYLPSWATKSFYSVANVLLHFGVMDELALPILFRGLATENEWVNLRRSAALKVISDVDENRSNLNQKTSSGEELSDSSTGAAHYFHPFNLHKVYSDMDKRRLFCSNFLLKVLQM